MFEVAQYWCIIDSAPEMQSCGWPTWNLKRSIIEGNLNILSSVSLLLLLLLLLFSLYCHFKDNLWGERRQMHGL